MVKFAKLFALAFLVLSSIALSSCRRKKEKIEPKKNVEILLQKTRWGLKNDENGDLQHSFITLKFSSDKDVIIREFYRKMTNSTYSVSDDGKELMIDHKQAKFDIIEIERGLMKLRDPKTQKVLIYSSKQLHL